MKIIRAVTIAGLAAGLFLAQSASSLGDQSVTTEATKTTYVTESYRAERGLEMRAKTAAAQKVLEQQRAERAFFAAIAAEEQRKAEEAHQAEEARRAEIAKKEAARRASVAAPPAPTGDVWQRLAQCESGMTNANTGNGYYGYFQFHPTTWRSVGGSGLPTDHDYATQVHFAQILQQRSGWGQWPACSRKLGLR